MYVPATILLNGCLIFTSEFLWKSGLEQHWRTSAFFMVPHILLFWTSDDVCPGLQSQGRVDSFTCMICHLHATDSSVEFPVCSYIFWLVTHILWPTTWYQVREMYISVTIVLNGCLLVTSEDLWHIFDKWPKKEFLLYCNSHNACPFCRHFISLIIQYHYLKSFLCFQRLVAHAQHLRLKK